MKSVSTPSYLTTFLRHATNSVSREVLVAHKVAYDLKLGSALTGFDLRVYRPDVDRDGFDMLIEQRSIVRVLQLKTVMAGSKTRSWAVRSHLLHPSRNRSERLGFDMPALGLGDGLDGGVLLMDLDVHGDEITIGYRLFDLAVAAMHACGLGCSDPKKIDQAEAFLESLRELKGEGTVRVPAWMFVTVPSAEGVLKMLGMRTRYAGSWAYDALWSYHLHRYSAAEADETSSDKHRHRCKRSFDEIMSGKPSGEVW